MKTSIYVLLMSLVVQIQSTYAQAAAVETSHANAGANQIPFSSFLDRTLPYLKVIWMDRYEENVAFLRSRQFAFVDRSVMIELCRRTKSCHDGGKHTYGLTPKVVFPGETKPLRKSYVVWDELDPLFAALVINHEWFHLHNDSDDESAARQLIVGDLIALFGQEWLTETVKRLNAVSAIKQHKGKLLKIGSPTATEVFQSRLASSGVTISHDQHNTIFVNELILLLINNRSQIEELLSGGQ